MANDNIRERRVVTTFFIVLSCKRLGSSVTFPGLASHTDSRRAEPPVLTVVLMRIAIVGLWDSSQ